MLEVEMITYAMTVLQLPRMDGQATPFAQHGLRKHSYLKHRPEIHRKNEYCSSSTDMGRMSLIR